MITWIIPLIQATSVPTLCRIHRSACRLMGIWRGSTRISLAPLKATARFANEDSTGWLSVVFEPVTRITSASSISAIGLVMAPLPNAAARPVTVDAWQRRAQ